MRNVVEGNPKFLKFSRGSMPPDPPTSLYFHCPHAPPPYQKSWIRAWLTTVPQFLSVRVSTIECDNLFWNSCMWELKELIKDSTVIPKSLSTFVITHLVNTYHQRELLSPVWWPFHVVFEEPNTPVRLQHVLLDPGNNVDMNLQNSNIV